MRVLAQMRQSWPRTRTVPHESVRRAHVDIQSAVGRRRFCMRHSRWHTLCTAASSKACNNLQRAACTARRAIIAHAASAATPTRISTARVSHRMPDVSAGARPVRPVRLAACACACVFDDACVSSGFRRHSAEWGEGPVQTVGMSCAREVPGKGHQHSLRDVGAQSLRGRAPPAATLWSTSARGTRISIVLRYPRAALAAVAKRLNRATERQDVGVSLPSGLRRAARAAADDAMRRSRQHSADGGAACATGDVLCPERTALCTRA